MNTFSTQMATVIILATLSALPACKKNPVPNKDQPTKKQQPAQEPAKKDVVSTDKAVPFNRRIERLTLEEALNARKHYKAADKKPQLAQTLERLLSLTTDHALADSIIIELADLRFELEEFPKAEALYHEHSIMYPGSEKITVVKAREIESAFRQILTSDRDQSKTKTTYELAQSFLKTVDPKAKISPEYKKVTLIAQECAYLLLEHELNQVEFYLVKYSYTESPRALKSAEKRLVHIKNSALPKIVDRPTTQLTELIQKELEDRDAEKKLTPELLMPITEKVRAFITDYHNKQTPEKPATTKTKALKRF